MAQCIAFLRAINVGGHVVKMERLRQSFAELGLRKVETFIASGNVIFEAPARTRSLERRIEEQLQATLGYEVCTFIRTKAELAQIAARKIFPVPEPLTDGSSLFVAFLHSEPSAEAKKKLLESPSAVDEFRFHGRELYWLCRTRASDSEFSGARLEKMLGLRTTVRNLNTIRRIVAKFSMRAGRASS